MNYHRLGQTLLSYRKKREMTIREFSRYSGISTSLISQIERGEANPSLNVLELLASALNVPLYTLFINDIDTKSLISRKKDRKQVYRENSDHIVYDVLTPDFMKAHIELLMMDLNAHANTTESHYSHSNKEVILQAAIIPFLIVGNGITIDGFTITSDNPYAVEFIQIGGSNNKITNNKIYGPPQAGPSTGWVVNRGFVTQLGNMTNLIVQGNIFYSLRQPAYLNPNTDGHIIDNVVYNTRGFVIDQSLFIISGNSWGSPENAVDIALLAGTTTGVPYDNLVDLSQSNSAATISDQR